MRQNRFYFDGNLDSESSELNDPVIIKQLRNVLRSKIGDSFILFDGKGRETKVEIKDFKKNAIDIKVISQEIRQEKNLEVCLYLAILKKENFELAVQKAVEAGVTKIIPIITERTIKFGLKKERLNLIIKEAAEQSGRLTLPILEEPCNFSESVSLVESSGDLNIFFDLDIKDSLSQDLNSFSTINIFIGPEGGWSIDEQEIARSSGFVISSLGQNVLRAETAAIVATWLAVNKRL